MTAGESKPPLAGLRVVDISTSYAGPTATMYLGDMGADVIKVERPGVGDDSRSWGPPFVNGESAWFLSANRNKRSICLDFSQPDGLEILLTLVESADVFVESLTPTTLERLGLAPAIVRARAPRLVYCAISGFGLTGPHASLRGYDLIAQARSGLMSVTGERDRAPQRVSTALSDVVAGMVAAFATVSALYRRNETGQGELVDVALLDSALALMAPRIASYLAGEPEPRPSGATDSVLAVYQSFPTADRPIAIAIGNDAIWRRLCDVLGLDELLADEGVSTNEGRRARRSEVVASVAERLGREPANRWLEQLEAAGIPCSPIQLLSEVVGDPQVAARGAIAALEHPSAGRVRVVDSPWRLESDGPGSPQAPPPLLGNDTAAVLAEQGYAEAEIEAFLRSGVAWMPTRAEAE